MAKKKDDVFHISPTALQAWCECPAKLWWAQRWELRKPRDNFGSNVHRRMEDGSGFQPGDFEQVKAILPKLRKLEADLGYAVLGREVEQRWEVLPGVEFTRRMDALAQMPTGRLAVVDYKSCSAPWPSFPSGAGELVAPKAMTLQAAGYVMPPPNTDENLITVGGATLGGLNWPPRAYFLMGPERGEAAWWAYDRNEEDEDGFMHLVRRAADDLAWMKSTRHVLRNRGDACDSRKTYPNGKTYGWACDWLPVCYDLPNWKRAFKRKER